MTAQPIKAKTATIPFRPLGSPAEAQAEVQKTAVINPDGDLLHTLIRQLVEHATQSLKADVRDSQSLGHHEIILDVELDGIRCVLIRAPEVAPTNSAALSPREQEIARMVARGYPNKTIAAVLEISSWTVCTHLRRMFSKLGVGSRAAMVAKLLDDGSLRGAASNSTQAGLKQTL